MSDQACLAEERRTIFNVFRKSWGNVARKVADSRESLEVQRITSRRGGAGSRVKSCFLTSSIPFVLRSSVSSGLGRLLEVGVQMHYWPYPLGRASRICCI